MIFLRDVRYVRLGTRDLDAAANFARDILGSFMPVSDTAKSGRDHQVAGIDDLMRSYYFLKEQGVKIVFGPGRHPTSSAMFLYFEGPDGMVYEYTTGVRLIKREEEGSYRPRQFPFEPGSFCLWGSRPDIPEFRAKAAQTKAA
ncbi:MAG TPA: VOC family protein [Opitutaceae bacterium]